MSLSDIQGQMPDLYATLDAFADAGPDDEGVQTPRSRATESIIFDQLMLDLAKFCNTVENAGARQEVDGGVAQLNEVYAGHYRDLRFLYGHNKNGNEIRKDVVEQVKKRIVDAEYYARRLATQKEALRHSPHIRMPGINA